jgi:HEAT repeat protein
MASFNTILGEIKRDCAGEHIPYDKISVLAKLSGPAEVDHLIHELDDLDDAELEDDAGDLGDEFWRLRTAYSQALAEVGEPAIEPMLRALGSENPKARAYVARALGLIGTQRAIDPIAALLAKESDDTIRMILIEALGELRDERAVEILLPYLKTPEQVNRGWIIRMAANALGRIGTESVIAPLTEILASDPDWFARLGAAEGLRKIQHPLATEALRKASNDEDARVRSVALAGLQ